MVEKMDHKKTFATCLEHIPCADMMRKILGRNGIGSLCADMMQKMRGSDGEGHGFDCAEMVRSMLKGKEKDDAGEA